MKVKRAAVEEVLSEYRVCKRLDRMGDKTPEPKITPSYEPRYHGNTNQISKSVEDAVVKNLDKIDYRRRIVEMVELAVSMLTIKKER
ncbi:hypothetical protein [Paenibacillus aquistagni]|uniref:hypothetical protein n=1 Tax=Paenibacillus aquistagni TaxID=1852522 RepID=UPI00145C15D2|nr:hypothetical protein [Paenibacillus aquistagni]NMM54981.1 hypothetical protein [Paenibacillus aquistagni]